MVRTQACLAILRLQARRTNISTTIFSVVCPDLLHVEQWPVT